MGSLEGELIRHHKNGKTDMQGLYLSDDRNGTFNYYDELGELQIIKYFSNGKIIGYSYNGTDGKPVSMIPVVNGTAAITAYFQNGKKSVEYTMSKGMFEGKYTEYFSNGKVYEESFYKNDELDGDRKIYYSSGKIRYDEHYKDGLENGLNSIYGEDGKLTETNTFYSGDRYGERTIYSSGKILKTILYYNDKIVYEK
jgi:antitoxin component YwqK of YwqJK toxin-antitoxin module